MDFCERGRGASLIKMKKDVWTDIVVSSALLNFFFSAPGSFRMDLISVAYSDDDDNEFLFGFVC